MRWLILALCALTACTPRQEAAWLHWHRDDPDAAVEYLYDVGLAARPDEPDHPGEPDQWSATGQCAQWYGTATAAGWSSSEWPTVDRIMYAESRCNPDAYNGASGVAGLMQIMPFWAADCGGTPGDLYDPWFNLACARHVRNVQGWQAWVTY